jgi:hypothetical protein
MIALPVRHAVGGNQIGSKRKAALRTDPTREKELS